MPQSNEASPSAATAVQPEAATPSNASTAEEVRETEAGPDAVITERTPNEKSSPAPAASPSWEELMEMLKGVACFMDAEAPSTKMFDFFPLIKRVSGGAPLSTMPQSDEASPSAAITERAPNEKGSPTLAVSPSWEELMEMLKGVSCFMDAEAPSMKMFDFFPLIKRVSVNMGGDPPNFVSAWLPFCTLESAVSCIQHLQEWTMLETVEVVEVGIRYMMRTRAQLFKRLEVAKAMRAFISHHSSDIEEMRSKLERVEVDLAVAQKAIANGAEMLKLAEEEKRGIRTKTD
uniref:Uncharacterized protein n=1 Tax=Vitis vinifera TaxID=29760 RepID=A5B841_VITVI|nr:hypothetical protein VITISV_031865 [Vitis vinifera]